MSEYSFKTCVEACKTLEESCPNTDCRNWMDYPEDLNCIQVCVEKNGPLTLREVSKRLGCSFVRVKQIEDSVLEKLKSEMEDSNYL
jgi:hypothetical protein